MVPNRLIPRERVTICFLRNGEGLSRHRNDAGLVHYYYPTIPEQLVTVSGPEVSKIVY